MKESVRHSSLFTKQLRSEKLTNSGVNLYSAGIVSSRSPVFSSFFSLAFALKRKNKNQLIREIKIKTSKHTQLHYQDSLPYCLKKY